MTFSVDVENRMIADMLDHKTSPVLAAQHALKADPALVAGWLDGVTTAAGAPACRPCARPSTAADSLPSGGRFYRAACLRVFPIRRIVTI